MHQITEQHTLMAFALGLIVFQNPNFHSSTNSRAHTPPKLSFSSINRRHLWDDKRGASLWHQIITLSPMQKQTNNRYCFFDKSFPVTKTLHLHFGICIRIMTFSNLNSGLPIHFEALKYWDICSVMSVKPVYQPDLRLLQNSKLSMDSTEDRPPLTATQMNTLEKPHTLKQSCILFSVKIKASDTEEEKNEEGFKSCLKRVSCSINFLGVHILHQTYTLCLCLHIHHWLMHL